MAWSIFCLFLACSKECDINDEKCTTAAAKLFYPKIVSGGPSWSPSDPITVDFINLTQPGLIFELFDYELTGLKNCTVEKLKFTENQSSWKYYLQCPQLMYKGEYKINGKLLDMDVQGSGPMTANAYGVKLLLSGLFTRSIGEDGKDHLHICSYKFKAITESHLMLEFQNLFNGDMEKNAMFNENVNNNWQQVDSQYSMKVLTPYMKEFVENINDSIKAVPTEQILMKA